MDGIRNEYMSGTAGEVRLRQFGLVQRTDGRYIGQRMLKKEEELRWGSEGGRDTVMTPKGSIWKKIDSTHNPNLIA